MSYVPMQLDDHSPIVWRSACPSIVVDVASHDGELATLVIDSLEHGRAAWQDSPGACQLPPLTLERGHASSVERDNTNAVLWRAAEFCEDDNDSEICLSPNAAAITTVFYYETGARKGEIVEADIEINGAIAFAVDGAPGRTDLTSALTHELGHVLGLDHSCEPIPGRAPMLDASGARVPSCFPLASVPAPVRESTMFAFLYPGEQGGRTPLPDEIAGVCEAHATRDAACTIVETSGCGCSGTPSPELFGLVVVIAVSLLAKASRRGSSPRTTARSDSRRSGTRTSSPGR